LSLWKEQTAFPGQQWSIIPEEKKASESLGHKGRTYGVYCFGMGNRVSKHCGEERAEEKEEEEDRKEEKRQKMKVFSVTMKLPKFRVTLIYSFINGSTALCWALASSSVS
jgi:hypothetical protein